MLGSTFFCKQHGVLENPQGKSERHLLERTLNGRTLGLFFKVVFYHLLDFSKKRTRVIVIDFQLTENTWSLFLSPPFFLCIPLLLISY